MNLSPEDVDDILQLLDSSNYEELHIDTGRFVLTLRREAGGWTTEQEVRSSPHVPAEPRPDPRAGPGPARNEPAASEVTARGAPSAGSGGLEELPGSERLHAVVAPLPGVFYRAPKPGAAPFVEVGDRVEPTTVVCILETMKLMNAIRADARGTVAAIPLGNGELAGQDAVLMWVRPDPA